MGLLATITVLATLTTAANPIDLHACTQQRIVAVAVLRTGDNVAAASAIEDELQSWSCVRLQQLTRPAAATAVVTEDDRRSSDLLDVDWLVGVSGTDPFLRARLIDPVTLDVLAAAAGNAVDIVAKLLLPVADELTSARDGGGRVGLVVVGATHAEFRALENSLRAVAGVTEAEAGFFRDGRGEIMVRSEQPRRRLLDSLDDVVVGTKRTIVTAVRPRRIEIALRGSDARANPVEPAVARPTK